MGANEVEVCLRRVGAAAFEAEDAAGHRILLDGPAKLGGAERGMRPMALLLTSLAGCSAMDVVMILTQQRQPLEDLRIHVKGVRADAVPAVYEEIHLRFEAWGDVAPNKLERAVRLSVEKYCSVASMLVESVRVTHSTVLHPTTPEGALPDPDTQD